MSDKIQIENLLPWGESKRVATKAGERILRKAATTEKFWEIWNANKDALKSAGVSLGKDQKTGNWEVCLWQPLSAETVQAENAAKEASRAADSNLEIPAPEGLAYLPYQRGGIAYAMARPNCLIADEMGLGKTIQAIGVINADEAVKKVLVVCPASLKLNWKREMEKWLVRNFSIAIADTKKEFPTADIIIVNYDILTKLPELTAAKFDLIIADECHYAKNPKAKRSIALYALEARRRVFLTGTPITNRPVELQPIAAALDSENFGNFWGYAKRYCDARNTGYGWDFSGASHLDELQDKLRRTIMVRRLKSEVLKELPAKRRQIVEIDANGLTSHVSKEARAAEAIEARLIQLRAAVEIAKTESEETYRAAVDNLKEESSAAFTELSKLRHETALLKVPKVIDHINNLLDGQENYKVVVFAHHKDVVADLMAEFGSKAVAVVGDTPMDARQAAVDSFQNDSKIQIFVGSIRAAGVGLTLTASSHVIFAEMDWTPANMSQAEDRCHRIGQVNSVLVQHLVLDGSLDVKFARTLVSKQAVIDRALDAEISETETEETVTEIEIMEAAQETATKKVSFERVKKEAEETKFTAEEKARLHLGLKMLAGVCDGATSTDGQGFNKFDSPVGKHLAALTSLTNKQAVLAIHLCRKYRRQLGEDFLTVN